jgi:nitroreductase
VTTTWARWTTSEETVLAAAAHRAPAAPGPQPWVLESRGHDVDVIERVELRLPRHDRTGRDRLLSCGAAVANLRIATRVLGWTETWRHFPDPRRRDIVALVRAQLPAASTARDRALHAAIALRHSHRGLFAGPAPAAARTDLQAACDVMGVAVVPLTGHGAEVVRLLAHAADRLAGDRAYRAELSAWTGSADVRGLVGLGGPDDLRLAVITTDDGPTDHLHAGVALQQTWLAATALGLAVSVATQPLHLPEVRAGLIEAADLPGHPQAILRVGLPAPTRSSGKD